MTTQGLRRCLLLLVPGLPCAAPAATGELWAYTMSMEMAGMSVPMGKAQICRAATSSLKPALRDNCKLEDFQVQGSTASFRAQCGPPESYTMSGVMTRSGDTLTGNLRMQQGGKETAIRQTARRLGGCPNPVD